MHCREIQFTPRCSPRAREYPGSGFVPCTVAELRGVKIAQFSDFGPLSPYKTPKKYIPVTSLQPRGYSAEWFRFFRVIAFASFRQLKLKCATSSAPLKALDWKLLSDRASVAAMWQEHFSTLLNRSTQSPPDALVLKDRHQRQFPPLIRSLLRSLMSIKPWIRSRHRLIWLSNWVTIKLTA